MELQEHITRLIITANALEQDGLHGAARAFANLARQARNDLSRLETAASDARAQVDVHD
jgi:hypothetical protein